MFKDNMENTSINKNEQEDEMRLVPLMKLCYYQFINNWGWFALSTILCMCIGWYYQQRQPRIYERRAIMLIEDANTGTTGSFTRSSRRNSGMNNLLELNGVSVGDNLKNEIFILSSKRLMQRVVSKLNADVDYTLKENLHNVTLYGNALPFQVLFQNKYTGKFAQQFDVKKKSANSVTLQGMHDSNGNEKPAIEVPLGKMVQTPYGLLCVVRGQSFEAWDDTPISVTRVSNDAAANRFMGELTASEYDKETSLIVLSCKDANSDRADAILATLYDTYKEDVVENKNRVACNTAKFIDERIQIIGRELSNVESQLASFKKRNQLVDFSQTSQAVLTETSTARQQSLQAETQLNVARYLDEYLHKHSNNHDLIPALNVGDMSFNTQIASYNDQMNKRNQIAANTNESQSVLREMDRQLAQMRQAIASSLRSYVNSLELRLRDARANEAQLSGRIAGAPDQEKQGLDIQRQQSLKEALYTYLLNKREEVALQQAINEANVRLVEGPIGGNRVSPRSMDIMLISLLIGLLIPSLVLWIRSALDVTVHSRKDVDDATSIPILGEVPHMGHCNDKSIITDLPSDDPVVEAFRILRFSLGYMRHDTKVIMTTSATPGQGKSFVARNMATILSMAGKRVLVIDADVRKHNLSLNYGHTFGLTNYLADEHIQLSEFVKVNGLGNGVDFLPAGNTPPNPSELLMSDRLEKLIDAMRQQYDYIIIDSTPMFAVADANIVNRVADMTLFVIRVGVQNRDFLPELDNMYKSKRLHNLCVVVNDADVKNGRYGCGYGYGYGYGYSRENKSKKNRVKRILKRIKK